MISTTDLNSHHYECSADVAFHLVELQITLNLLEIEYAKAMKLPLAPGVWIWRVTSGLRSAEQQKNLIAQGKSRAIHSKHLTGQAADIYDPHGSVHMFAKAHEALLEKYGVWCEERQGDWQHFQIVPPESGKRWFNP